MKKVFSMFLAVCITLALASCTKDGTRSQPPLETPIPTQTQGITPTAAPSEVLSKETLKPEVPEFEGKIAFITNSPTNNNMFRSVLPIISKYGEDKVIHMFWPDLGIMNQEEMTSIVEELGEDLSIKAIIINWAIYGTNLAIQKLQEIRKDIFVVSCTPKEKSDVARLSDLSLITNEVDMGSAMVQQAQKLGAETFVHYSSPRHMSASKYPAFFERRELIRQECKKLGMEFVDVTCLDLFDVGIDDAYQFIIDDIPKMVNKYGKDTAFFCTDYVLQFPLVPAVIEAGAIFPQPCNPSPYQGIIQALDTDFDYYGFDDPIIRNQVAIANIKAALAKKNMLGRLSTWPVEDDFMYTYVGAEYAVKWINGEVSKESIDIEVLKQLMEDYAGVEVYLTPYTDKYPYTDEGTGETYDNFLMMRMDYLTFE